METRDRQLLQLFDGVTDSDKLVSWEATHALIGEGLAGRTNGYNFLTRAGVQAALRVKRTVVWHQIRPLNSEGASRRCPV